MKDRISEKYRKYLLKVTFEKRTLFIIWGTDLASPEENDFIILDQSKKVICFEKKSYISEFYAKSNFEIRDKANFNEWLKHFSFKKEYCCYNIDLLTFETFNSTEKLSLINNINLITDYISQTTNTSMSKLREKRIIKTVWNQIYNTYFWKTEKQLSLQNSEIQDFITSYNDLISAFKSKFRFIV